MFITMSPFVKPSASRAAALLLVFSAPSAFAASPSALMAQYSVWRGGQAFARLKSVVEAGRFTDGGLSGPAQITLAASGATYQFLQAGPLCLTLTTADHGANSNLSGQLLPLAPTELAYAEADAASLFPLVGAVTYAGAENLTGQNWAVLDTHGAGGAVYSYLISPRTGALYGIRAKRNGGTELTVFSDWRFVDGVRLPFHVHTEGDADIGPFGQDTTDLSLTTISLNNAPPPPPLHDRLVPLFDPGETSSGWVPFDFLTNEIFLPITLNGHKVQALLDSGASATAVDRASASLFGVRGVGHFTTAGQGGSAAIAYAPNVTIDIGTMRLPRITTSVIDLGLPGLKIDPPLVAILGAEAFIQTAVEIDYANHRLRFFKSAGFTPPRDAVTLPLGTALGYFTFPVSVNGAPAIPVILDLGNDAPLQLFPAYWQSHPSLADQPATSGRNVGIGGLVTYRLASVSTLGLGTLNLHDVPTAFEPTGIDSINPTAVLGNIGEGILHRFKLIIDFPNRRISFLPVATSFTTPFKRNLTGLESTPSHDMLKIISVMPGSPAAKAGLVVGDSIVAIDGSPVQKTGTKPIDNARAGTSMTLTLKGGIEKIVLPARFY